MRKKIAVALLVVFGVAFIGDFALYSDVGATAASFRSNPGVTAISDEINVRGSQVSAQRLCDKYVHKEILLIDNNNTTREAAPISWQYDGRSC